MRIRSVHLTQFRNFRGLDLEVGSSVNVFYGSNAQGKTNLLEAIYLCACARSHRTSRDRELIMRDATFYKVRLLLSCDRRKDYEESVSLSFYDENHPEFAQKSRRIAEHDDIPVDKLSRYVGIFNAVIFAPEDMLLIKEGPSVRRRYLDLLISQVRPMYFFALQRYSKLLQQRNRTLKIIRSSRGAAVLRPEEEAELEIWDLSMAKTAAEIISERIHFSEKIAAAAKTHHGRISSETENLFVRYRTVGGLLSEIAERDENKPVTETIEKHLTAKWKSTHHEDFEKGITTVGPHRDDLELSLDGEGLRPFASQGQQRSAALAMKMAELDILREETGETPVLLLDDVFSELDHHRRAALLSGFGPAQVFITCTDKDFVSGELLPLFPERYTEKQEVSFFRIENGEVYPEQNE